MIEVNGRVYPFWSQFIEKKAEWVGGRLLDEGDSMDRMLGCDPSLETVITDITLEPNGDDSAFFRIVGKDFSCGFDVRYGGIAGGEGAYLTFSGYGGHTFHISKPEQAA